MKIGEILKRTNQDIYGKLVKQSNNYDRCMQRKCKTCKKQSQCFNKLSITKKEIRVRGVK